MIAFLTSSPTGPLDGSRPVDGLDRKNFFVENLKRYWKTDARCLMIAASPDAFAQNEEMTAFFEAAVKKADLSVSAFDLLDRRNADFSIEELQAYDVIFMGGGHVPTQNRFFEEIGLRNKMSGYDGMVIGISAGTMNCADRVYAQPELSGEAVNPEYVRFLKGLGITQTMILPHYQMVKDWYLDGMKLYEDITYADSWGREFLVLTDGSYLLLENGKETVWGEAYRIADGKIGLFCEENCSQSW